MASSINRVGADQQPLWFDFSGLPLHAGADHLHQLASEILDLHLGLGGFPSLDPVQELTRVPVLSQVFPGIEASGTEPAPTLRQRFFDRFMGPIARLRLKWVRLDRASTDYYRPITQAALANRFSPANRRKLLLMRLGRRFLRNRHQALPGYLWPAAGCLAFEKPEFAMAFADKISRFLRQRVILPSEGLPPVRLHARTLWLLIALYRPPRPARRWRRWLPGWRRQIRAWERLSSLAQQQALGDGWADFWDQWLLLHVLQQQPDLLRRLRPTLRQGIARLPLLAATSIDWPEVNAVDADAPLSPMALVASPTSPQAWLRQLYDSHLWEVPQRV